MNKTVKNKETKMSTMQVLDNTDELSNKILQKLKGKSPIQKVGEFILKRFIKKCTIKFEPYEHNVLKYLYQLDPGKFINNSSYKSRMYLKLRILYNSGKRNFTVNSYCLLNNSVYYKLGNKAYLYVSIADNKNDNNKTSRRICLYFTGRNVLPFVMQFINYLDDIKRRIATYAYNYERKDFMRLSDNSGFQPDDFVISNDTKDKIMNYIRNGIKFQKKSFNEHGIVKNPGLLLYGLPGTGKTTLIKLIAHLIQANIYI